MAARTQQAKPAKEALEAAAEAPPAIPDGVFVAVEYGEDGNYKVDVQALGQTRVTEIDTILGFARKHIQERLGLS